MKPPRFAPSRRHFVKTLGAAALTAPFFTRHLRSAAPSATLRHASFGSAGQAWADIQAITSNPFVKRSPFVHAIRTQSARLRRRLCATNGAKPGRLRW